MLLNAAQCCSLEVAASGGSFGALGKERTCKTDDGSSLRGEGEQRISVQLHSRGTSVLNRSPQPGRCDHHRIKICCL